MSLPNPTKPDLCQWFVNSLTGEPIEMRASFTEDLGIISENVRQNIKRFIPQVRPVTQASTEAMIVCGGPSINQLEDEILRKARTLPTFAVNGSHDWLLDRRVTPTAMVMVDARASNNRFLTRPQRETRYLLASQCHPSAFDLLSNYDVLIWHAMADPMVETKILQDYYLGCCFPVQGGSSVGTRTIMLAAMMGFTQLHVYGLDSCYLEGEHHAYNQPENDKDGVARITCNQQEFLVAPWHVSQAIDFVNMAKGPAKDLQIEVYGPGLIAHIVRSSASACELKAAE